MSPAERFRSAVRSDDFAAADAALAAYVAPLRAGNAPLEEVAMARQFLASALEAVAARRVELGREAARLNLLQEGYRCRAANTWSLSG